MVAAAERLAAPHSYDSTVTEGKPRSSTGCGPGTSRTDLTCVYWYASYGEVFKSELRGLVKTAIEERSGRRR